LGIAECPGVPEALAGLTMNAPYNDLSSVEHLFTQHKKEIAAVIIEPIAANMGVVLPQPGFLAGLRELTRKHGALLIVDEVITGFRIHNGAVQQFLGVEADITTLGKIIGGGLPVGAYGARAELMNHIAPLGPVYQAGTLAGNPLAMRAGIATLQQLTNHSIYHDMAEKADRLASGLRRALAETKIPGQVNSTGSLSTLFFASQPVTDYGTAKRSDTKRYAHFFREMLDRGIFLAPSQFEAAFVSTTHTKEDIDRTLMAARASLEAVAEEDQE
jgi:glutamate-1-semialdehyde 2,1-aminomutase